MLTGTPRSGSRSDRAGQRGAERGPEVRHRVLDAADLGASSSGTAETVTAPSCEASAPIPSPIRSIGTKTISGPASASSAPSRTSVPASSASRPLRTTSRGETSGKNARDPDRGHQQRDRERQQPDPGRQRGQAEADREEQRHDEEEAGLDEVLEEEHGQAAGSCLFRSIAGRDERLLPARLAAASPSGRRSRSRTARRATSQTVGDSPAQEGRPRSAGSSPSRRSAARRRRQREPDRRKHRADEVESGPRLRRGVRDPPRRAA